MPTILNRIKENTNLTRTENNAVTHRTSLSHCLDFFSRAGGLRAYPKTALQLFQSAFTEDRDAALKSLFYLRDVRGGQGERNIFRVCNDWLAIQHPHILNHLCQFMPEYGRWDDVVRHYSLLSVRNLVRQQWELDKGLLADKEASVSLLAKWLPSLSASNKEQKALAKTIASTLTSSQRDYRHALTALRSRIDIVEKRMCEKDWSGIDFSKVPSQAMHKLRKAFWKNDPERFKSYLEEVAKGETKINASTITPDQLFGQIVDEQGFPISDADPAAEAQWNAMPTWGKPQNILPVLDCSASMNWHGGHAMRIARSVGIFCAERNATPLWANKFITFADEPAFIELDPAWTLAQKAEAISNADVGYSTDLVATFRLILDAAVQDRSATLPDSVIIISDMEFNEACENSHETNFEAIERMFLAANLKRPNLVFWNVQARTANSPVTKDENGTALVSGRSPSILSMAFAGDFTPESVFKEMVLDNPRYAQITPGDEITQPAGWCGGPDGSSNYHDFDHDDEDQCDFMYADDDFEEHLTDMPDEEYEKHAKLQEEVAKFDAAGLLTSQERHDLQWEIEHDTPLARVAQWSIEADDKHRKENPS